MAANSASNPRQVCHMGKVISIDITGSRRRRISCTVLAISSVFLLGQKDITRPAAASDPTTSSKIAYHSPTKTSGWIPFDVQRGHIYLTAKINGQKVPALLDSGASVIVINQPAAVRLGVRPSASEIGHGAQGSTASDMASGVTVSVGDLSIRSGRLAMPDLTGLVRRLAHPLTVVLGGEFFSQTVLDIDFQAKRLRFCDPAAAMIPAQAEALHLYRKNGLRFLNVAVEGHPARVMLDLGNGGAMNLTSRFWTRERLDNGRPSSPGSLIGYGGAGASKRVTVRSLRIGRFTLTAVPTDIVHAVVGSYPEVDGNVGLPVWARFHIILDFRRNRVFMVERAV